MKSFRNWLMLGILILSMALFAADKPKLSAVDYKANEMLTKGQEYIAGGDKDRGLELLKSIPQQYPASEIKFKAYQALGVYYSEAKDYTQAAQFFQLATGSSDEEIQADAYYHSGICHFNLNSYDKAFSTLRKVISDFPDSVYANEAFYYIGLCHFKLSRWSRAVEALELVGTRVVEVGSDKIIKAEAGQRLFIKVKDIDLVVLTREEGKAAFQVKVVVDSGDTELVDMFHLGKSNDEFLGSIQTVSAVAAANDKNLQTIGNEKITVTYNDANTLDGNKDRTIISKVEMVSTASAGFTDGAFQEFVEGVFAGQQFFVRVKDFDKDISAQQDKVNVKISVCYKVKKEEDLSKDGIVLDQAETIEVRDSMELELVETAPHSGIFTGSAFVAAEKKPEDKNKVLSYLSGDYLFMEYSDELNITEETRELTAKAAILESGIQDVRIVHREVDSNTVKARKELIEAKILLRLSDIFKNVGLVKQADEKANEGLQKANIVIDLATKFRLSREIAEEAYNVKWDIYLVKDNFELAIATCNKLIELYPDSILIDRALMKVAQAKLKLQNADDINDAIKILEGITLLKSSQLKPEAQFLIATAAENLAISTATLKKQPVNLSNAMIAYKKCVDLYPDSKYAGEALEKISNFYISTNDFQRTILLMEQVFQDYPDASFLDVMLYKWAFAAYKMRNFSLAREKAEQLVNEYPNSKFSANATKMIAKIDGNNGSGTEETENK